ncbi:MAG TPA: SEC-C metal-binding domain-containing protein, partial [Thermoanaerobaculia bacterium]|nr:SEC-C metal-binding domain-containing protein [Thermoanaerobaculia bacterium]
MSKANRNEPCPCGSGKKNKKCCGAAETPVASRGVLLALAPLVLLAAIGIYAAFSGPAEPQAAAAAPAAAPLATPPPATTGQPAAAAARPAT